MTSDLPPTDKMMDFSYFPGCSLATTAAESNQSLMEAARILGFNLIEIPDWNCCGSSSAQTMCRNLALGMAARNLSLAPRTGRWWPCAPVVSTISAPPRGA